MALLSHTLKDLSGDDWRAAKKAAGVKGAKFFTLPSGKGVADKIDAYQSKRDAYRKDRGLKSLKELFLAVESLDKALTIAIKDREFASTAEAKTLAADVKALQVDIKAKSAKYAAILSDKTKEAALAASDKKAQDGVLAELGL